MSVDPGAEEGRRDRNNANVEAPPGVAVQRKEPHENIARIAKRYLDDNMQQAWINPRLISMRESTIRLSAPRRPIREAEFETRAVHLHGPVSSVGSFWLLS
ncbi:hypothetical protein KM043_002923 [Ampulex compressa]|nr:hypothetical protein KM043_002923 [Ampulex compressa]